MSKVTLAKPLASASGKLFGQRSKYSLRTNKKTGAVSTYKWPDNYEYPIREGRQRAARRLRDASLKYNEASRDSEKMRVFREAYEAHQGRIDENGKQYSDLRHYIIAWYMKTRES